MTKHFPARVGALVVLTLGAGLLPALATGVTKTWVSSTTGNDTGTCQFVTPCKTFAYAITQTLPGGEIDVKDGGSYGPVTISQAVSIVSDGVLAAIAVPSGGVGIDINAGSGDVVTLQGLVVDGHGVGDDGVDFRGGRVLKLENCHIRNLTGTGLNVTGSAQAVRVEDSEVTSSAGDAVFIGAQSKIDGNITRSYITDSLEGIVINNSSMLIIESTITGNNSYGVIIGTGGDALLGNTTISGNTGFGVYTLGGTAHSYGDNYINSNGADINGSFASVAKR